MKSFDKAFECFSNDSPVGRCALRQEQDVKQ